MEGFAFYLNESAREIQLAEEAMSQYVPRSAAERFFEDGEEPAGNQQAISGVGGHLKQAIAAIKQLISKVIDSITTFFQTAFMSKQEKDKFLKFKQMMAQHPEYKNKKITVKDFREINQRYRGAIDEIDKGLANIDRQNEEQAQQTVERLTKLANDVVGGIKNSATTIFSMDTALRLAENNRTVAQWIQKSLKEEGSVMNKLEQEVGAAEAQKFKKKIDSCTKKVSLHRLRTKILGQWTGTMSGATNQVIKDFEELASGNTDLGSNLKRAQHMDLVDAALGSWNTKTGQDLTKGKIVKGAMAARGEYKQAQRQAEKQKRDAEKRLMKARKDAQKKGEKFKKDVSNVKNFLFS